MDDLLLLIINFIKLFYCIKLTKFVNKALGKSFFKAILLLIKTLKWLSE